MILLCSSNVWHARIGHASADIVHLLPVFCKEKVLDIYDNCHFAKQSRLKFPTSVTESKELFDPLRPVSESDEFATKQINEFVTEQLPET